MKALVLSGGYGSRLRPITHTYAKQLVPVANKPILFYALESIAQAGITDVGIVVGDTADEVRDAVGDGTRFGLTVEYVHQERPLGIAHAVMIARDTLGDDDFLLYLGDNFLDGGVAAPVEQFRKERPDAQVLLTHVPDPSSFGVAELDSYGRLIGLAEKPAHPRSDLAVIGVYLFTAAVHEAVRQIEPSGHGELEITDALQWLIENGATVRSQTVAGFWRDTGTVSDILDVNDMVLDRVSPRIDGSVDARSVVAGRVVVERGARVRNSRIIGPAIIGAGALITDSVIGPATSVASDCHIDASWIESSIVLPMATIIGMHAIEKSLIGRNVRITGTHSGHQAHRLVLGDHCRMELPSSL